MSGYIDDHHERIVKIDEAITVPGLIGEPEHWQFKTIGKYIVANEQKLQESLADLVAKENKKRDKVVQDLKIEFQREDRVLRHIID